MVDAQFLQSRRFTVEEIARIFRCPPPAIGDLTHGTYSNVSELGSWLVKYTLRPWMIRIEQAMRLALLSADGQRTHMIEHNAEDLLRGDQKTRHEAYASARQWGWMSQNEIRQRENLSPIPDGDEYLQPLNMESQL